MKNIFHTLKKAWMAFAHAVGWFNTRVLLTLTYLIVIGIPAIIVKLFRKDLLNRKWRTEVSYWVAKEKTGHSIGQARHQF